MRSLVTSKKYKLAPFYLAHRVECYVFLWPMMYICVTFCICSKYVRCLQEMQSHLRSSSASSKSRENGTFSTVSIKEDFMAVYKFVFVLNICPMTLKNCGNHSA